jgi:nucleoside-diphosphate-sugar epimerase
MAKVKIAILGGAGYIGSWLTRFLLESDYDVTILDMFFFGRRHMDPLLKRYPNLDVHYGDMRNASDVAKAVNDADVVVNLGGLVGDPACGLDENETWLHNVASTNILVDVCNYYQIKRLLFASSCSAYGAAPSDVLLNEGSRKNPVSLYARTKIESEKIFERNYKGTYASVRLGTVFGSSLRPRFDLVVNKLTVEAVCNGNFTIFGGKQFRAFTSAYDAAMAFKTLIETDDHRIDREAFNVCVDSINMIDLAQKITSIIPGCKAEFITSKEDDRNYRVSSEKFQQLSGFEYRYSIDEGIALLAEWVRKTRPEYQDPIYHNHMYRDYDYAEDNTAYVDGRVNSERGPDVRKASQELEALETEVQAG